MKRFLHIILITALLAEITFALLFTGCAPTAARAVLSSPVKTSYMKVWSASDTGVERSIETTQGGQPCWALGKDIGSYYIVADVDDRFISPADSSVEIIVEYFDAVKCCFSIQYNSVSSDTMQTETVQMQGSNSWLKHTFEIDDAAFRGTLSSGDFRIRIHENAEDMLTSGRLYVHSIGVKKTDNAAGITVETFNGILARPEEMDAAEESADALEGIEKTVNGASERWALPTERGYQSLLFDVDEPAAKSTGAQITVEYYDAGYDLFALHYNSSDIAMDVSFDADAHMYVLGDKISISLDVGRNSEKLSEVVWLDNSEEWKKYTFVLADAVFENALNGCDFRLCAYREMEGYYTPTELTVKSVEVKKQCDALVFPEKANVMFSFQNISTGEVLFEEDFQLLLQSGIGASHGIFDAEYCGQHMINVTVSNPKSGQYVSTPVPFSIAPRVNQNDLPKDIFGVCTHFGKGWYDTDFEKMTALISSAGIGWIRDEMEWSKAETVKGKVEILPEWDEYIDTAIAKGIEPLIILDFGNDFYDEGGAPYSKEGLNAFINYVATIVEHFKDRVEHFEIWNEYNLTGSVFNPTSRPPEDYAAMLELAYDEIKRINPNATVIGGVMAGADTEWLNAILDKGAHDHMDAVSFHPYVYPNTPENGRMFDLIEQIETAVKQRGKTLPIWITEIGWPTAAHDSGVSETYAASFLVRTYAQGIAEGIDKIFWYNWQDKGVAPTNLEHNFGLVRNWDDTVPAAAKASYLAYTTMTGMLSGCDYIGDYSGGDLKAYRFSNGETDTFVLWSSAQDIDVKISSVEGTVRVFDLFGNETTLSSDADEFGKTISGYPIFVKLQAKQGEQLRITIR